ncbi:MAG: RHS repeat-associated core domain-containing protein [Saprospiraceae bacterium]
MPYGETMVEQKVDGDFSTPYRFTGKEEDVETGLYYYGARYYDPKLSIWMSVDPLADKYPSLSPYNYTMNNPLRFTDSDGRKPQDAIILIWGVKPDYQGHGMLAVENFKYNDDGKLVSDGTYSLYGVNATESYTTYEFARDPEMVLEGSLGMVKGSFTKEELLNFDQGNGTAEAVIQYSTNPLEDFQANELLTSDIGHVNYSLSGNDKSSCTLSCLGLIGQYGSELFDSMSLKNSMERISHGGVSLLGINPVDFEAYTPSSIYNSAREQGSVLRGNNKRFSLPFIDSYSGYKYRDTTPKE